jgi:hypothetical protein
MSHRFELVERCKETKVCRGTQEILMDEGDSVHMSTRAGLFGVLTILEGGKKIELIVETDMEDD